MGKLTKAQMTVLNRLASGDQIGTTSGRTSSTFWWSKPMDRAPSFPTLHALSRQGLIDCTERTLGGGKYCITDAGRAALGAQP
jgi:DNA-binding PadR family transcriptional regulator